MPSIKHILSLHWLRCREIPPQKNRHSKKSERHSNKLLKIKGDYSDTFSFSTSLIPAMLERIPDTTGMIADQCPFDAMVGVNHYDSQSVLISVEASGP